MREQARRRRTWLALLGLGTAVAGCSVPDGRLPGPPSASGAAPELLSQAAGVSRWVTVAPGCSDDGLPIDTVHLGSRVDTLAISSSCPSYLVFPLPPRRTTVEDAERLETAVRGRLVRLDPRGEGRVPLAVTVPGRRIHTFDLRLDAKVPARVVVIEPLESP